MSAEYSISWMKNTFFSAPHRTSCKENHILGHKFSQNINTKCEKISHTFSDYNGKKHKSIASENTEKLKHMEIENYAFEYL
jgi:hypothetical protein